MIQPLVKYMGIGTEYKKPLTEYMLWGIKAQHNIQVIEHPTYWIPLNMLVKANTNDYIIWLFKRWWVY